MSARSLPALRRLLGDGARGVARAASGVPLSPAARHWWFGLRLQAALTPPSHLRNAAYSFYQPRVFAADTRGDDAVALPWLHAFHPFTRQASIHFGEVSHMQTTPEVRPPTWYLRYDAKSFHRNKSTGWNFTDDALTVHTHCFYALEEAVEFCRREGLAFVVFPPRLRAFKHKSYADNFVWKGPAAAEEIDF